MWSDAAHNSFAAGFCHWQSLDPMKRLGCEEMGGYEPLKQHSFFDTISWSDLDTQTPPKLTPYLPAMSEDDEDCYGNVGATIIQTHKKNQNPEHTFNLQLFLSSLCLSTTTSSASSATCRLRRRARHTPCRRKSLRRRRGPAATLSSTSTTSTITLLSWTCSSRTKRSDCCWINRPQETPGKHATATVALERKARCVCFSQNYSLLAFKCWASSLFAFSHGMFNDERPLRV